MRKKKRSFCDLFVFDIQGLTYLTTQFDKKRVSVCLSVSARSAPPTVFVHEKAEERARERKGERERVQCNVLIALILQAMQL